MPTKNFKNFRVLVNSGLLQCRDVGSWWLGIPGAGVFMKHFTKGRQNILRMIRKRKFKEILQRVIIHFNDGLRRLLVLGTFGPLPLINSHATLVVL